MRIDPRPSSGFTLIEVLIASSLSFAILTASLSSLMMGIKTFERFRGMNTEERQAMLMERMSRDLRLAAESSLNGYRGGDREIIFASWKGSPLSQPGLFDAYPVRVHYRFDRLKGRITRLEDHRPFVNRPDAPRREEVIAEGLKDFKIDIKSQTPSYPERVELSMVY